MTRKRKTQARKQRKLKDLDKREDLGGKKLEEASGGSIREWRVKMKHPTSSSENIR